MRYGLASEPIAVNMYAQVHNSEVNIYPCGIVVSPYSPWLAASPDRKVFNFQLNPCYGVLEVKCPVSKLDDCKYLNKNGGKFQLKKNHNYFYQVMMQLAVTGLEWCHFFVWRPDEYHLELIRFDSTIWDEMKNKLDVFFFNYFL